MATTLQIRIELDDKGLVTGLQRVGTAVQDAGQQFTNMGQTGHQAYDRMSNDWEKAHVAQILAARTIGVEIPRALMTMMLQSQDAMKVFSGLFALSTAGLFIQGLATVLPKLQAMSDWAMGYTQELKDVGKAAKEASDQALVNPKDLATAQKNLDLINDMRKNLEQSNKEELEAHHALLTVGVDELGRVEDLADATALTAQQEAKVTLEAEKGNDVMMRRNQLARELLSAQNEAAMVGLTGLSAILQEAESTKKALDSLYGPSGGADQRAAAQLKTSNQIEKLNRDEVEAVKQIQAEALQAGITGIGKLALARDEELRREQVREDEALRTVAANNPKRIQIEQEFSDHKAAINQKFNAQEAEEYRQQAEAIRQIQAETLQIGVSDIQKLGLQRDEELRREQVREEESLRRLAANDPRRLQIEQIYLARKLSINEQEAAKEAEARRQMESRAAIALLGAETVGATGVRQILLELAAQRKQIADNRAMDEKEKAAERVKLEAAASQRIYEDWKQRDERQRSDAETVVQEQERAAIASLPPWQRADAQVLASYRDRIHQIDELERKRLQDINLSTNEIVTIEEQAQQRREAAWADANAQIADNWRQTRDKLANDLEALFTGDIGQNILKQVEHFFFQILASFLMMLGDMRQAGAGGGGIGGLLGAIFGGMLGGKSGGATLPPGVQPTFGGAPGSSFLPPGTAYFGGNQIGAGSTAAAGAGFDWQSMLAGGPTIAAGSTAAAGAPQLPAGQPPYSMPELPPDLLAARLPAVWPGSSGGAGSGPLGPLGIPLGSGLPSAGVGIPSMTTREGALGLAGAGIGMVGAKLGGTAGSIGGMIAMLAVTAAGTGPGSAGATALLNFFGISPAIAAGAVGGLIGFGVGQKYGKLPGMIAGAASGAGMAAILMAMTPLGPIGIAIGAIVGLLGGLFGGLLGGSQRRAQANAYVEQQVEPALSKLLDSYNSFGSDFASTMASLIDIQTQAQSALSPLKGEGADVYQHRVLGDIQKELDQIMSTETERQRRSGLTFGPPQFAEGGFISPELPRTATGGVLAELHPNEFVSTAAATALHRQQLEAWNVAGTTAPASQVEEAELAERNLSSYTSLRTALPQFEQGGFVGPTQTLNQWFHQNYGGIFSGMTFGPVAAQDGPAQKLNQWFHQNYGGIFSGMEFGPPGGGTGSPSAGAQPAGIQLSNGQVLAALLTDESGSTPQATAARAALEAMNAGQTRRQPTTVIIQAWDGDSVARWLRNGGDRQLDAALRGSQREYSGRGLDIG